MFELRGAGKRHGDVVALQPLDLSFAAGSTAVLIGPSGSGKSTLIRLLVGLLQPDSGEVLFDGRSVTPETAPGLRRRMGYVIQDGGLFPHLTAAENVGLMAGWLGWSDEARRARIAELAALVRIPVESLERHPAELSGGQRQRVSLMRALALDPDVLLLDEPLGALDPMIRRELQEDLRAIFRELGKTVVLVTHDLGEAAFFGEDVLLMEEGRLAQRGSLRELLERPASAFVTRFVNAQRSPVPVAEKLP